MSHNKSVALVMLSSLFLLLTSSLVWADDKAKDEETLKNANTVLEEMLNSKTVPPDLLGKANCVIVIPNIKKFAIGIGGSGGRGPMSCRTGKSFEGKWSAPAMFSIGGTSAGLQVGGSSSDFVLLVMAPEAVDKILAGKTKVGRDMTAAAGPSGATSAGSVGGANILTYGRAKGLFAGMSLSGASLAPDEDANKRLYSKEVSAREIVIGNSVKTPAAGEALMLLLDSKVAPRKK